ncbi:glycosyltransferase family 2 protein [Robiginitomaculum antarcticum]|uniref:glycosyltransferase family 2 protein n=1 Tax=Robiginitomaculum antarcticum TaxID=437507 RepID=UPI00035D4156|nr:glycosyltransferase family 2 protein [Robiginitomaculum antarcticum]
MTKPNEKWARIVIVSYNSGSDLQTCIDSLAAQTCQDFEVTVVDNASPDTAIRDLKLPNDRYEIYYSTDNMGFAKGSNLGAKFARTEWIITLNPDAWPEPEWLDTLKTASTAHPAFSMLSTTLLQTNEPTKLDGIGDYLTIFGVAKSSGWGHPKSSAPAHPVEVFGPCGAAAGYRRDIFEKCGGFDDSFFCYLEDVDLSYRLRLYGEKCLLCPDARATHVGSSSTEKHSGFKFYHSHKNNFSLIIKNTPLVLLLVMLPLFLASQIWIIYRNRNHPNSDARVAGFKDGMKSIPGIIKKRRRAISGRQIGSWNLAKRLSWTIGSARESAIVFWPIEATKKSEIYLDTPE